MARNRQSQLFTQITIATTFILAAVLFLLSGLDLFGPLSATPTAAPGELGANFPTPSPDSWWQVYFTDPRSGYTVEDWDHTMGAAIQDQIDGAARSIHIAGFELDLAPVAQALVLAHQRGVDVRWITDDENGLEVDGDEGKGQFALLIGAGIEVRDDGRSGLMHNKFMVIDGRTVWTGSTNFTQNDFFLNNNNSLLLQDLQLAEIYEAEFAEMWAGSFGPGSPSTAQNQYVTVENTPIQVLFGPEDKIIEWIIPLVEKAKTSVVFMAYSFTDDPLADAMLARHAEGVAVQGIIEARASDTEFSELAPLFCGGVAVRQDGNSRAFHHKVIVIDAEYVLTGSFNFSENANTSNDENILLIASPQIAARYLREFNRRWDEASIPTQVACP